MDPVSDLQMGFKDAMTNKQIHWDWSTQDTLILVTVLIILAIAFLSSHIFQSYRFFVLANRKERKKREFLTKLLVDRGFDRDRETILLKRLVKYYSMTEIAEKVVAPPEQLVEFSRRVLKLMRRLEYDERGRLVIPGIEKELDEAAQRPEPETPPGTLGGYSTKDLSKAAKVALNFIKMRQLGT